MKIGCYRIIYRMFYGRRTEQGVDLICCRTGVLRTLNRNRMIIGNRDRNRTLIGIQSDHVRVSHLNLNEI